MNNKNFEVFIDCGSSKMRAGAFDKNNSKNNFYHEGNFFFDNSNITIEIEKIISSIEKDTSEYLNEVNLMIDSSEMLSINISIAKKLDGSKLKEEDIQFLVQDVKQQVLRNYLMYDIAHIIIKNYKLDEIDYIFLPNNINCNFISLDILFICLPKNTIEFFKKLFLELNVSTNQIYCSSYAKSFNYKENLSLIENISFIDIGFEKTSIISYKKNEITFIDVLPVGGNHITKDISKILKLDLLESERIKLYFDKNQNFLNEKKISLNLINQIISARTEEILELSIKSIRQNLIMFDNCKIILMGKGSKILDSKFKEKISLTSDIDLLEETTEDICESGLKMMEGMNRQEVLIIPKKQIDQGFFEKLFHFFK